jgi:hypothetical protein
MTTNQQTYAFFQAVQCELSALMEPHIYGVFARGINEGLDDPRCDMDSFAEDWSCWAFSELLRRQSLCGRDSVRVAWDLLNDSTTPRGSYLWGAAVSCLEPVQDASAKCAKLIAIAVADDGPECFDTMLFAVRAACDRLGPACVAQSIIHLLGHGGIYREW